MISGQEAQAKFNEYHEAQGSHDELYTDGSKMNERVGAAAVINRHFQNGETTLDPLASDHYTDMKPLVNSYIQKLVQTKWDVVVHGRDLYLVKPTLGPPNKFLHLTRAEEVVITWLRIGHTKATKSYILSRGPSTVCNHCGQTLTIDCMFLECAVLQKCHDEYYTVDSLTTLFEIIPTFGIRSRAALSCVGGRNVGGYGCNSRVVCRSLCIM